MDIKPLSVSDFFPCQVNNKKRKNFLVSTELSLSIGFQRKLKKIRPTPVETADPEGLSLSLGSLCYSVSISSETQKATVDEKFVSDRVLATKIEMMKNYTPEEEEEENRMGVTTKLKLYHDPWGIKKKATVSDINYLCRLLLTGNSVSEHILPFLSNFDPQMIESGKGKRIMVWDMDTGSEHVLVLKKWKKWKNYVFNLNWRSQFVKRRSLNVGDEVGMFWDSLNSRLCFSVLGRAERMRS